MGADLIEQEVFTMEPKTLEEAMKFADLIAKSSLVPRDFQNQPGNVLIAIQMGREIGLKPMQALQNIAVINGRPCVWGDALPAIAYGSKQVEDFREDFEPATMTATCQVKRKGQPTPIIRTFSQADAEKAGLWRKLGTWQTFPKRMLQMRARAFALRDGFSDYLKGLSVAEEIMDIDPVETTPLPAPPSMPKRISETTKAVVEPEWKHVQTTKEGICGVCKEKIQVGVQATYSAKQGLRCGNCDPLAGPKQPDVGAD